MRMHRMLVVASLMVLPIASPAQAQALKPAKSAAATATMTGEKWGPAPAVFPAGAEMAVMQGNPGGTGVFTVRLRFPDNYRIPPHTHPTDEMVTVISGTLHVGMGDVFKSTGLTELKAGGFITAPAGHSHYVHAQGATVVQVHAVGPFALTYVNKADTPKAAK
jgi:quercetin dioxygenase-like cupin family protein